MHNSCISHTEECLPMRVIKADQDENYLRQCKCSGQGRNSGPSSNKFLLGQADVVTFQPKFYGAHIGVYLGCAA